jgi:Zn-dependent peptidase ImmA (M78 family)
MSTQATASPARSPLGDLRAVWPHHATDLMVAMSVAHRQAGLLREILAIHGSDLPLEGVLCLPGITVTAINDLPVPGTAFWGNEHWNIHVREQDPPETQRFNALHELKHIIDHPGRRATTADDARLSDEDEELVADHFATCVLTGEAA